jgi:iron complex outermembrane receptor protein
LCQGLELSLEAGLRAGFPTRLAATYLRAIYDQAFTGVAEGNRLPGVPKTSWYGELAWKDAGGCFGAALETVANGKVRPDDANAAIPAPGYTIVNARVQASQHLHGWHLREYARVNNLFGRTYIGSVILGDSNRRYYEPAPQRNWVLGTSAKYEF